MRFCFIFFVFLMCGHGDAPNFCVTFLVLPSGKLLGMMVFKIIISIIGRDYLYFSE